MHRVLHPVAMAFLLAAPSLATAAAPITFKFAWEPGMECAVTQSETDVLAGTPAAVGSWKYAIGESGEGLSISTQDLVVPPSDSSDSWAPTFQRILEISSSVSYVITRDGSFVGYPNVNPQMARMRLLRASAPSPGLFDGLMQGFTYPEAWLQVLSVHMDDVIVAPFTRNAARFKPGKTYQGTNQQLIGTPLGPALKGVTFRLPARITLTRVAPCGDDAALRCATFTLKQTPSNAEMTEEAVGFRGTILGDLLWNLWPTDFEKNTVIEIEPDTSVPHRVSYEVKFKIGAQRWSGPGPTTPVHWRVDRAYTCTRPKPVSGS